MPQFRASSLSRLALRYQVNRLLAERGADVRIVDARNATEHAMLGDSYLVDRRQRHIIIRDHVDLHKFAQEIGVSCSPPDSGAR